MMDACSNMGTKKNLPGFLSRTYHWLILGSTLLFAVLSLAKAVTVLSIYRLDGEQIEQQQIYPAAMAKRKTTWSDLKVAVFMTTHWSPLHVEYLQKCWHTATTQYPLLHDAHLIMYTSTEPDPDILKLLHFQSITIKIQPQPEISKKSKRRRKEEGRQKEERKQMGAKRAMTDPWPENATSGWFDGYDWVVRLNPDVLVRNDIWLRETMLNETVDLIAINYRHPRETWVALHTDFYAFRPEKMDILALRNGLRLQPTAEQHMGAASLPLRAANRIAWIPGAEHGQDARVIGQNSPVIHEHTYIKKCPNYYNAT